MGRGGEKIFLKTEVDIKGEIIKLGDLIRILNTQQIAVSERKREMLIKIIFHNWKEQVTDNGVMWANKTAIVWNL